MGATFEIRTAVRRGTVQVDEYPRFIIFVIKLDRYGEFDDTEQVVEMVRNVTLPYMEDKRPLIFFWPDRNEFMRVDHDGRVDVLKVDPRIKPMPGERYH